METYLFILSISVLKKHGLFQQDEEPVMSYKYLGYESRLQTAIAAGFRVYESNVWKDTLHKPGLEHFHFLLLQRPIDVLY